MAGSTKLFVGNIPRNCNSQSLKTLFETMGRVSECDVVKDYAFVHYVSPADAEKALKFLDGTNFQGCNLRIQVSHSKVRSKPGMGDKDVCYRCGKEGHWSKDCHLERESRVPYTPRDEDRRRENKAVPMFIEPHITTPDRYNPYDRKPEIPLTFPGYSLEYAAQTAFQSSLYNREFSSDSRTPNFNGSTNLLFQNTSNSLYTPSSNPTFPDSSAYPTAVNIRYPVTGNSTYPASAGIIGFDTPNPTFPGLTGSRFVAGSTNLVYPQADSINRTADYYNQRLRTPVYGMEINGGIDVSSYLDARRY